MERTILKLYIKNKIRPFAVIDVEDDKVLDELLDKVNSGDTAFKFGQVIVKTDEFRYAEIYHK